ncbi:NfeD family protein [Nodosilinea sp. E11]|uniref:NfeD family protein n=1 Tax=Nodosilinea sp. E11 TaxID=3037479 RepID=UPI003977C236
MVSNLDKGYLGNELYPFNRLSLAKVDVSIEPIGGGRVCYQGSVWPAQSTRNLTIEKDKFVLVTGTSGITLLVEPYS